MTTENGMGDRDCDESCAKLVEAQGRLSSLEKEHASFLTALSGHVKEIVSRLERVDAKLGQIEAMQVSIGVVNEKADVLFRHHDKLKAELEHHEREADGIHARIGNEVRILERRIDVEVVPGTKEAMQKLRDELTEGHDATRRELDKWIHRGQAAYFVGGIAVLIIWGMLSFALKFTWDEARTYQKETQEAVQSLRLDMTLHREHHKREESARNASVRIEDDEPQRPKNGR